MVFNRRPVGSMRSTAEPTATQLLFSSRNRNWVASRWGVERSSASIHTRDKRAANRGQPVIQGADEARVGTANNAQTDIGGSRGIDDFIRAVRRAVIDNDKFEIGECLLANTGDRFRQVQAAIVNGHHYR